GGAGEEELLVGFAQRTRRDVVRERDIVDSLERIQVVVGEQPVRAVGVAARAHDLVEIIQLLLVGGHGDVPRGVRNDSMDQAEGGTNTDQLATRTGLGLWNWAEVRAATRTLGIVVASDSSDSCELVDCW